MVRRPFEISFLSQNITELAEAPDQLWEYDYYVAKKGNPSTNGFLRYHRIVYICRFSFIRLCITWAPTFQWIAVCELTPPHTGSCFLMGGGKGGRGKLDLIFISYRVVAVGSRFDFVT